MRSVIEPFFEFSSKSCTDFFNLASRWVASILRIVKTLKRIPLGVINISATPHTNDGSTYIELFKTAFGLHSMVRIKADNFAIIASCVPLIESEPQGCLTGEIHKFTEISGDWENLKILKPATDLDIKSIQIPDYLKPNREAFRFFLFPKEHRMVFQLVGAKRSISHVAVKKVLEGLFSHPTIKDKYPMISVIVEQEPESLERIFKIPHLNYLRIYLERPNPDSLDPESILHVEKLLRDQGAKSLDVELNHAPYESLKPNNQNQKLAHAAGTSNGKVIGKGRDENNRPITIDTSDHPIAEGFDYDKKSKITFIDQMFAAAGRLVNRIKKHNQISVDKTPPKDGTETKH
jgi:hypothetical protein